MCKSGICGTKTAISLKRSGLEPKLLQGVYRNLCTAYRLVTNLTTRVNFGLLFREAIFFHNRYLAQCTQYDMLRKLSEPNTSSIPSAVSTEQAPACNGQTDRRTTGHGIYRAMHRPYASRGKNHASLSRLPGYYTHGTTQRYTEL